MEDPPLNPSEQVERIREILIGRQMHQVEDRLRNLEGTVSSQGTQVEKELLQRVQSSQAAVIREAQRLREQLKQETEARTTQIDRLGKQLEAARQDIHQHDKQLHQNLSAHLENISSAMAARIDARIREILQHLQGEFVQWKNQVDRDLQAMRDDKVSRAELKNRFARLASAAMQDDPPPEDGFLL
ncbi:MAG: hypothetical protein GWO24_12525 [Akkermansiaceae bacterium]|nr:hypothetical protein [Akkermansiaceae bacterium]